MEQSTDWLKAYQPRRVKEAALRSLALDEPDQMLTNMQRAKLLPPEARLKLLEGLLEDVLQGNLKLRELSGRSQVLKGVHGRLLDSLPKTEGAEVFSQQKDKLLESLFKVVEMVNRRKDELAQEDVDLTSQLDKLKEYSEKVDARKRLLMDKVIKNDSQGKKRSKLQSMVDEMFGNTGVQENNGWAEELPSRGTRHAAGNLAGNYKQSLSHSSFK